MTFHHIILKTWSISPTSVKRMGFPSGSVVKNLPAMQETQFWSLGWEDPLEEGMATHCSILAWRIQWTEEPGELQSMGSQRVRQDWVTFTFLLQGLKASWGQGSHVMFPIIFLQHLGQGSYLQALCKYLVNESKPVCIKQTVKYS